jgi:hypothetical protein
MSSITLNFTINIDSAMLRTLLASARDIQLSQTIDPTPSPTPTSAPPSSPAPAPVTPTDNFETNSVIEIPSPAVAAPVALITNERKAVQWNKKTISLVPEEQIAQIANRIEMGELSSANTTYNWYTKYHPLKERALRIVTVLRNSPSRSLTFQNLLAQTGLPNTGNDSLQGYLREMDKQGVITYSPRD